MPKQSEFGEDSFSAKHEMYPQFKADVVRLLTADPNITPINAHRVLTEYQKFKHDSWARIWSKVKKKFLAGNLTDEEDEEELDPEGFAEEESESDDESYVEVVPKKAAASRPSLVGNRSSSRKTRSSTSTGRTGASLDSRSDIRTNNGTVMLPYVTFPYESFTQQGRVMIQVIKIHSLSGCVNSELGYSARVAEGNSDILIEFHKNDSVIEFYKQGNRYLNPRSSVYCSELQHGHDYAMSTATRSRR